MADTRRRVVAILGVVLAPFLVAACGGGGSVDVNGGSGSSGGSSGSGGVLNVAIGGEPDQLDPHKTSAYYSFEVLENVYDTLVEPDQNLQMQPSLATGWKISKDQKMWTFTIRKGVKFSDGTPLTAKDVAYSYHRIIDDKLSSAYKFAEVTSIQAPDPQTLVVKLKQPMPNLLSSLGSYKGMAIVEKKNVESGAIKQDPVGSGPFKVASWQNGDSIKLVRNPYYWGPKPKISGVDYTFVKDPTVALQNLESGEVDWTDNLPPQQISSLKSNNDIVVKSTPTSDYWYMALNEKKKPFDNRDVRRAISFAIDRNSIVKAAKFGNATVNETAIPKTSAWYYDYSPYDYNPTKAKALLKKAGVSNLSMDLMVTSEYPETVSAAQVISDELSKVGITVKIRNLDFATWLDDESKGDFDSFMLGWLGNIDPDEFYYSQHHTGGAFNFQGYSNPKVDKLLDQARTETNQATRKQLYDRAAKMIVDDASYIYLYNPDVATAWSPKVHGFTPRPDRAVRFRDVSLSQ
jgi:peptide/nickel transport system substrate-binding protein